MKKVLLTFSVAVAFMSCADDGFVDKAPTPSSKIDGIEVVTISDGYVLQGTRTTSQKGEFALKFDSEEAFNTFKGKLSNASSFERESLVHNYGIQNLFDLANEADEELENLGNKATSLSDFKAKYSDYKKKYEGLLISDSQDTTDVSLSVPNENNPESYIANKEGYYVVGNSVRKVSCQTDNYPTRPSTPGQNTPSQEGTIAGTNKVVFRPLSNKKIYFEAYAQGYYIRVKMSAKKHMWYGWKNDPHRQYFFDSYLANFVYLGKGQYGQETIVNRLPRYIFNNQKNIKNGFDIILGRRPNAGNVTGEFHVWCDLTSEHDKDGKDITEKVGNFVMPKCLESKAQIVKINIQ